MIDKDHFPDFVDHVSGDGDAFRKFIAWRRSMYGQSAPIPSECELDALLPVRRPNAVALASPPADQVQATWLGHASVLTQFDGWSVLCGSVDSNSAALYVELEGYACLSAAPMI